ncbi:hypothetical protein EGW08_005982 [Elysia chlorotica]|uniref:Uncharacterized protein n=1 Tax=Elysia chlorotica TaxID=188477 RepID=A0A433TXD0_ELYCH|nr:hypothetical protein EGW08_005982 [Elysia chlorotica]
MGSFKVVVVEEEDVLVVVVVVDVGGGGGAGGGVVVVVKYIQRRGFFTWILVFLIPFKSLNTAALERLAQVVSIRDLLKPSAIVLFTLSPNPPGPELEVTDDAVIRPGRVLVFLPAAAGHDSVAVAAVHPAAALLALARVVTRPLCGQGGGVEGELKERIRTNSLDSSWLERLWIVVHLVGDTLVSSSRTSSRSITQTSLGLQQPASLVHSSFVAEHFKGGEGVGHV